MNKGGIHFRQPGDWFHPHFREIIRAMLKRDGRNFLQCELCPAAIPEGQYQLHHTKYEGATYYDLKIVCRPCNQKAENKLLI